MPLGLTVLFLREILGVAELGKLVNLDLQSLSQRLLLKPFALRAAQLKKPTRPRLVYLTQPPSMYFNQGLPQSSCVSSALRIAADQWHSCRPTPNHISHHTHTTAGVSTVICMAIVLTLLVSCLNRSQGEWRDRQGVRCEAGRCTLQSGAVFLP